MAKLVFYLFAHLESWQDLLTISELNNMFPQCIFLVSVWIIHYIFSSDLLHMLVVHLSFLVCLVSSYLYLFPICRISAFSMVGYLYKYSYLTNSIFNINKYWICGVQLMSLSWTSLISQSKEELKCSRDKASTLVWPILKWKSSR